MTVTRKLTEGDGVRIQEDPVLQLLRVSARREVVAYLADLLNASRADLGSGAMAHNAGITYPTGTVGAMLNALANGALSGSRLSLVDQGLMTRLWSYRVPGGEPVYSSPVGPVTVVASGTPSAALLFTSWDWFVYALRVTDGALLWRTATGATCYGRCQAADVNGDGFNEVFAASQDGNVWSLDKTGALRWKFANLYDREASGTATAGTGATTLKDSAKAWAANAFLRAAGAGFGASVRFTSGGASGQAREITARPDGQTCTTAAFSPAPAAGDTYVIDPRYSSDRFFMHAGTLVQESGSWFVYVTSFDNHCYKINADTGALVWKFATLENIEPYPLVVSVAGNLRCIVVSIDGYTRSLNAATGVLVWQTLTGQCDAFVTAADVDVDGALELIVSSRDNRVYLLDAATGAVKAQTTDTAAWDYGDIDSSAVPVLLPGSVRPVVVTGGDSGTVWSFDSAMATRWNLPVVPNAINSSPVFHDVLGDGGVAVLIGDMRGTLHCVDVASGKLIGCLYFKGGIEGMPLYADIDGDGRPELVVTTTDGYVEAFRFSEGAVFSSAYFPGDTAHAGRQA